MDKKEIMKFIVDSLMKEGYSLESATAVAATMAVETGDFKDFTEKNGTAIGYLQWDGVRKEPFNEFMKNKYNEAKKTNPNLTWEEYRMSPEPNIEYFINEANGDYNNKLGGGIWTGGGNNEEFKNIKNVDEALDYITSKNLRPRTDDTGTYSNWDRRQQETIDLYKEFGGTYEEKNPEANVNENTNIESNIENKDNIADETGDNTSVDTNISNDNKNSLDNVKMPNNDISENDNKDWVDIFMKTGVSEEQAKNFAEAMNKPLIDNKTQEKQIDVKTSEPTIDNKSDINYDTELKDTELKDTGTNNANTNNQQGNDNLNKSIPVFQEIYNRDKELSDRSMKLLGSKTILDTALTTGSLLSNLLSNAPETITAEQSMLPTLPTQRFTQEAKLNDAISGMYAGGRQIATEMGRADIIPGLTAQAQQSTIEGMANIGMQELERQKTESALRTQVSGQNAQLRQQANLYNDQKLTEAAKGLSEVNAQLLSNYSKILSDYIKTSTDIKNKDAVALSILDLQKAGVSPDKVTEMFRYYSDAKPTTEKIKKTEE